jgi:FKBP-type peptidyl-prolyl cis-trans isomerase 2
VFYVYIKKTKEVDMDNLIEVASFTLPDEAYVLESILQKENIKYFLSNSVIAPGVDTRLMVDSEDIPKTIEILKESGFEKYLNNNIIDEFLNN